MNRQSFPSFDIAICLQRWRGSRRRSASNRRSWGDIKQFVNVYVEKPDEHCARAKAAGAIVVADPQDTPFGARFYAARDPEGFLWWLSTYKPTSTARSPQPHI